MDSELELLGQRLKQLRNERELTMDMVVTDMNTQFNIELRRGNLSKWENGINVPSLRMAAYLCAYYHVSLDYLIGNTDSRVPVDLLAKSKRSKDK